MTSTPSKLMTAEDLFELPDDGRHYELVRGELKEMSPAGPRGSRIAAVIAQWLLNFAVPRHLGSVYVSEAGFIIRRNPDTVRAPDVAFVRADRLPPDEEQDFYLPLAPDLAVEVISPSDRLTAVQAKVGQCLEAGVRLVWVVNPRTRQVTVHQPGRPMQTVGAGQALDGADVLPGFTLPLSDLFA